MEKIDINNLDINILPLEGELKGALERIPIPEGLEERLSAKIDEWDLSSRHTSFSPPRGSQRGAFLLAASFLLVCGIGLYFALAPTNKGTIDTYNDPQLACQEAENALQLLATNLNKGMAQYEAVNAKSRQAEEILNKQLTKLKY